MVLRNAKNKSNKPKRLKPLISGKINKPLDQYAQEELMKYLATFWQLQPELSPKTDG